MTSVGVSSLITSNWRLPYDPEVSGREEVNVLPVPHSRLSAPMHRFTWRRLSARLEAILFQWKLGVQRLQWRAQPARKSAGPGALNSPFHWQSDWCFCLGGSKETVHHYLIWRFDTQMEVLTPKFIDLSKARQYQIRVNQDGRSARAPRARPCSDASFWLLQLTAPGTFALEPS